MSFTASRVEHQVKYLGLLENVKVKRAGYAYRHFKNVFLDRFGAITEDKNGTRHAGVILASESGFPLRNCCSLSLSLLNTSGRTSKKLMLNSSKKVPGSFAHLHFLMLIVRQNKSVCSWAWDYLHTWGVPHEKSWSGGLQREGEHSFCGFLLTHFQVRQYKENERVAQQKQGKHSLKPKCVVM